MFQKMTIIILAVATTMMLHVSVAADNTIRLGAAHVVKAWRGTEGIQVWTLRYGPRNDHTALVQITNIDHAWDKKIQVMSVEKKPGRSDYSIEHNGKKFVVLVLYKYNYGELYLPGEDTPYNIYYSSGLSSEGNAGYFLNDYLSQSKQ